MRGFGQASRHHEHTDSHEPLARLRRRCIAGAVLAVATFVGAAVSDFFRHSPLDNMVIVAVEMAAVGTGALCAVIATTIWVVTQSVENALMVWRVAAGRSAAAESEDNGAPAPGSGAPIPIDRGRAIQRRHDRHAV